MGKKEKLDKPLGELEVSVRMARNLVQKVLVGKQSPFVQFEIGDEIKKTGCDKRGGRNPQWSDELSFVIFSKQHNLTVKVFNRKSKIQADYIGEAVIDLLDIFEEREKDAWFTIRDRGAFAGDVYVEFTFHPHGVPRTTVPRTNAALITEVEEGLSMLSLKNIQNDPRLNTGELPTQEEIKSFTAPDPKTALLRVQHRSSSASISSTGSSSDPQFTPANESDLTSILDEIRSLVDYPYHVPAVEQALGPGALPSMRRKPLPQVPQGSKRSSANNMVHDPASVHSSQNTPSTKEYVLEGPFDSPRSKPIPPTPKPSLNSGPYSDFDSSYYSPSIAPSSVISDLNLGDPVSRTSQPNSSLQFPKHTEDYSKTGSLRRRGSADSIAAFSSTETWDHDPASEVVEFSNSKVPSFRRRPMEAPSILQSHEIASGDFYVPRVEDVRGRPIYYIPYPDHQPHHPAPPAGWAVRPAPPQHVLGHFQNPQLHVRPVGFSGIHPRAPPPPAFPMSHHYPVPPSARPLPRPRGHIIPPDFYNHPNYRPNQIYYPPYPQFSPRPRPDRVHVPGYPSPTPPVRNSPQLNGYSPNFNSNPLPPPKTRRPPSLTEY